MAMKLAASGISAGMRRLPAATRVLVHRRKPTAALRQRVPVSLPVRDRKRRGLYGLRSHLRGDTGLIPCRAIKTACRSAGKRSSTARDLIEMRYFKPAAQPKPARRKAVKRPAAQVAAPGRKQR